jgi:hypothetical protein
MYYYVELLRALRALRVVGIILALGLVAGVLFRLSLANNHPAKTALSTLEQQTSTARVKRTRLPNGNTRIIIDDPQTRIHAVIDRRSDTTALSIMEFPQTGRSLHSEGVVVRDLGDVRRGGTAANTNTVLNPGNELWWGSLLMVTIPIGLLVATMLGGPLAKENQGHLELAWTKPVPRETYAFAAVFVDVATMVVAQAATAVVLVLGSMLWAIPHVGFESGALLHIGLALIAPLAWYGCLTALSASLKRGPGAAIGIAWVAAIITPALAQSTLRSSWPVAQLIHLISTPLSFIDPLTYVWFQSNDAAVSLARSESTTLIALAGLSIVYIALAVVQWRRVEA